MAQTNTELIETTTPALTSLSDWLAACDRVETPGRLLALLTRTASKLTGAPVAAFTYDQTGMCELVDEHALPPAIRGRLKYPNLTQSSGQPEPDLANWATAADVPAATKRLNAGPPSLLMLRTAAGPGGGVIIWGAPTAGAETATMLELIIHTAGGALHRLKLAREVKTNLAQTMALQRITQAITRSLDFDQVSSTLLRHARKLFQVEAVALALAHPDKAHLEFYVDQAIGLSDEYIKSVRVSERSKVVRKLLTSARPIQFYDVSEAPLTGDPKLVAKEGIKSLLLAPIFSGGQPVGALALIAKHPRQFDYSELRFSQSLAEQAGIAFANANLHDSLRKVSYEIEQTRNLMRDGLLVLDLDRKLRYFNAAAGTLLGLTAALLQHKFPSQSQPTPKGLLLDRPQMRAAITSALEGRLASTNFSLESEGHEPGYFEAVYAPYRDAKGALVGVLINIRDTTSLYQEKDKLRSIQNNIADGLIMVDAAGRTVEHNAEWRRLFDSPEDLIGQPFFTMLAASAGFV